MYSKELYECIWYKIHFLNHVTLLLHNKICANIVYKQKQFVIKKKKKNIYDKNILFKIFMTCYNDFLYYDSKNKK